MTPESPPPPLPPAEVPPRLSLFARLANVFAAPGETFDDVKQHPPSHANWLLPLGLAWVVGLISVFVIFSQPSILQRVKEQQDRAIERQLQNMGKEQREQTRAAAEKFMSPLVLKFFGASGAIGGAAGNLLLSALAVWAICKLAFKAEIPFIKALEVAGLAGLIAVLGTVITTCLVVGKGHLFATPGPMLLVAEFNPASQLHMLLAACNVITIWQVAVLALGAARLGGGSYWRALGCLLPLWMLFKLGAALLGAANA